MPENDLFLFVSHVSEDRRSAMEIVKELERRGVKCWIAPRDVQPGQPFDDEIVDAIESSRAMLLVFSDRCNESEYIRREVTVAGESHKLIIPFRIEDAQPRRGLRVRLSDLHWIDGFAARERAIEEIARRFSVPAGSAPGPDRDRPAKRAEEQKQREKESGRNRFVLEYREQTHRLEEESEYRPYERRRIDLGYAYAAAGIIAVVLAGLLLLSRNQISEYVSALRAASAQSFHDCSQCPEMVIVPAGRFVMGTEPQETKRENIADGYAKWERPQHLVVIPSSFAVSKFLITRYEYAKFVESTARDSNNGCADWKDTQIDSARSWKDPGFAQTDRDPVMCVSWEDAKAYATWLSSITNKNYRLLSEGEWEYVARAGTTTARYWGELIGHGHANCIGCGSDWEGKGTSPVGSFEPNHFKLYDMLGNAFQWVEDCWEDNYGDWNSDSSAAQIKGDCTFRVLRGGSWYYQYTWVRSGGRFNYRRTFRGNFLGGIRIARTL